MTLYFGSYWVKYTDKKLVLQNDFPQFIQRNDSTTVWKNTTREHFEKNDICCNSDWSGQLSGHLEVFLKPEASRTTFCVHSPVFLFLTADYQEQHVSAIFFNVFNFPENLGSKISVLFVWQKILHWDQPRPSESKRHKNPNNTMSERFIFAVLLTINTRHYHHFYQLFSTSFTVPGNLKEKKQK